MCTSIRPLNYLKMSALFYIWYRYDDLWWSDRWIHYLVFKLVDWLHHYILCSFPNEYNISIEWQNIAQVVVHITSSYYPMVFYHYYDLKQKHSMSLNPFINSKTREMIIWKTIPYCRINDRKELMREKETYMASSS